MVNAQHPVIPSEAEGTATDNPTDRQWGMGANLAALIWVVGPLAVYFFRRDSGFVRFHALQALLIDLLGFALAIVLTIFCRILPAIGAPVASLASLLLSLILLVAVIFLAYQAYLGKSMKLPVLGELAQKYSSGSFPA